MRRRIPVIILLLALITGGVYFALHREKKSDRIRLSGNIEVTEVAASFQVPGRMVTRLADEGDIVRRGDTIAVLDDSELARQVAVCSAQLQASLAQLKEYEDGNRPEDIAAAAATLDKARADSEQRNLDYLRAKKLYATGVVTASEYDAARTNRDAAEAMVEQYRQQHLRVKRGFRQEEIDAARGQAAAAAESLRLAELRLGYARLFSPVNGVVLSKSAEDGEYLATGATVVTIADLDHVWVRAYLDETDLGCVKLGQTAEVRVDSFPDSTFVGRVAFISSAAEFTPRTVQTEKERVKLVYRVKIDLDNPAGILKPGMPADAYLARAK